MGQYQVTISLGFQPIWAIIDDSGEFTART